MAQDMAREIVRLAAGDVKGAELHCRVHMTFSDEGWTFRYQAGDMVYVGFDVADLGDAVIRQEYRVPRLRLSELMRGLFTQWQCHGPVEVEFATWYGDSPPTWLDRDIMDTPNTGVALGEERPMGPWDIRFHNITTDLEVCEARAFMIEYVEGWAATLPFLVASSRYPDHENNAMRDAPL